MASSGVAGRRPAAGGRSRGCSSSGRTPRRTCGGCCTDRHFPLANAGTTRPGAVVPSNRYRVSLGERTLMVEVQTDPTGSRVVVDGRELSAALLPADASGLRRLRSGGSDHPLLIAL